MEYTTLGNSGLRISKICLSTMYFGKRNEKTKTLLSKAEADAVVKKALDAGITFFETSCQYQNTLGASDLGEALQKYSSREKVVLAVTIIAEDGGLSRKEIFRQVQQSMKLLRTNYLDHVIIQGWDGQTAMEETMEALYDLIKIKQIKSIGASTMRAYQFLKAQEIARSHHWRRFTAMWTRYNLIYREAERELVSLLKEENVSMFPYAPLVSKKVKKSAVDTTAKLLKTPVLKQNGACNVSEASDHAILLRMKELAEKYGVTMAQISLAWLLQKEWVAAPVVEAASPEQVEEIAAALAVTLTKEDMQYLEELYIPHNLLDVC